MSSLIEDEKILRELEAQEEDLKLRRSRRQRPLGHSHSEETATDVALGLMDTTTTDHHHRYMGRQELVSSSYDRRTRGTSESRGHRSHEAEDMTSDYGFRSSRDHHDVLSRHRHPVYPTTAGSHRRHDDDDLPVDPEVGYFTEPEFTSSLRTTTVAPIRDTHHTQQNRRRTHRRHRRNRHLNQQRNRPQVSDSEDQMLDFPYGEYESPTEDSADAENDEDEEEDQEEMERRERELRQLKRELSQKLPLVSSRTRRELPLNDLMAKLDQDNRILAELDRQIERTTHPPDVLMPYPHHHVPHHHLHHQTPVAAVPPAIQQQQQQQQQLFFLPLNNLVTHQQQQSLPSHGHHHQSSHATRVAAAEAAAATATASEILDSIHVPNRGRARVLIAKYSYDPFRQSPNENPESELSLAAGDFILVFGDIDSDGFFYG